MSAPSLTKIQALEDEIQALRLRLVEAEEELLIERFGDKLPKYKVGDIVLVPRLLFGKQKMWPAKIIRVNRSYHLGIDPNGDEWESKVISYSYFLRDKNGNFGGTSDSEYEDNIEPSNLTKEEEES